MKFLRELVRVMVAGLMIFSGLIKMNDPVGMGIKMEEYFEVFSSDLSSFFEVFIPISLQIAVLVIVLEVALGVALLFNFRMKQTTSLLLGLIVFFTALTFYSAFFNKVTDCGCFGDAIKLTPWQSFYKDVVLLILSGIIWVNGSMYVPYINIPKLDGIMVLVLGVSIYTSVHTINHLPFIDFRTYAVGNSIPELMQPSGELQYEYVMIKDGKEERLQVYPTDKSYTFKEMIVLNPEVNPKITDYGVWNDEGEYTEETFKGKKLFIIVYSIETAKPEGFVKINELVTALESTVEAIALTATDGEIFQQYQEQVGLSIPFYYADATVLKTMIRSNPGIFLMQDGVVKGKWHYNDTPTPDQVSALLK